MGRVLYWLLVLAVSLAFVVGLILFLERRDRGSIERADGAQARGPAPVLARRRPPTRAASFGHTCPRRKGIGSSQAITDLTSQRRVQASQASRDMPASLAAAMSCHGSDHLTPGRARPAWGRGSPVRSA